MSVRMSNLDNERDERDEDSHEDRGISECTVVRRPLIAVIFGGGEGFDAPSAVAAFLTAPPSFPPLSVSNTRFIAAVLERHTHTPERRRRYWGRSGTESDHGRTRHAYPQKSSATPPPPCPPSKKGKSYEAAVDLSKDEVNEASRHRWKAKSGQIVLEQL